MPSLSEKEKESLERMAEVLEKIQFFAEEVADWPELEKDELRLDAILMNFIVLGECIIRLSERFLENHSQIEWSKIKALRNIVAHDYWGVDVEMVWQIVQNNLPVLSLQISEIIKYS
ncbi:MAG: HepT-like ribonuclease domain-containing protein [Saprospiraceae bacterium]